MKRIKHGERLEEHLEPRSVRLALEPRYLFDAAALLSAVDAVVDRVQGPNLDLGHHDTPHQDGLDAVRALFSHFADVPQSDDHPIVIVDSRVQDYEQLLAGLDPSAEVYILDPSRDGIEQVSEILADQEDVTSIHLVSHGDTGRVYLGTTALDASSLVGYADEFAQWDFSLARGADILLYGCRVGADDAGIGFIERLSELTGADVSASGDITGASGDWVLEIARGSVTSAPPFDPLALASYQSDLEVTPVAWTGLGDATSWTDPNNWDSLNVPGDETGEEVLDVVIDDLPATSAVDLSGGSISINSLTLNGETLNLNGGSLDLAAASTTDSTATIDLTNTTLSGTGSLTLNGTLNSDGTSTISLVLNNNSDNSVNVDGGTLVLSGGGTSTGTFSTASGATLHFQSGTFSFDGASIDGTGDVLLDPTGTGDDVTVTSNALDYTIEAAHLSILGGGADEGSSLFSTGFLTIDLTGQLRVEAGDDVDAYAELQSAGNQITADSITVAGGDGDGALAQLESNGGATQTIVTTGGGITIAGRAGGGAASTSTYIVADGPQDIQSAGAIDIDGGSGDGAEAGIWNWSPTDLQSVSASSLFLDGGAGAGAYATLRAGSAQTVTTTGNTITLTGGAGASSCACIEAYGGDQIVTVTGDLAITAGSGEDASAGVYGGFFQEVSADNISLKGGSAGSGASATISSDGSQSVTANRAMILTGGAGNSALAEITSSDDQTVSAESLSVLGGSGGNAYAWLGTDTSQDITVTGNTITIAAGSGATADAWIEARNGSQSIVDAGDISISAGAGDGSDAGIGSYGGFAQTINAGGPNGIQVQGGSGSSGAFAEIVSEGAQTITAPNGIALSGGEGNGAKACILESGNSTGHSLDQSQEIHAGALTLQGGNAPGADALINHQGGITGDDPDQAQLIDIAGAVSITGGSVASSVAGIKHEGQVSGERAIQTQTVLAGSLSLDGGAASSVGSLNAASIHQCPSAIGGDADLTQTVTVTGAATIQGGSGTHMDALVLQEGAANGLNGSARQTISADSLSILGGGDSSSGGLGDYATAGLQGSAAVDVSQSVTVTHELRVAGGPGTNAWAYLDHGAVGSGDQVDASQRLSADAMVFEGGAGTGSDIWVGTYGGTLYAPVSDVSQTLTANGLTVTGGSGNNSYAVVSSESVVQGLGQPITSADARQVLDISGELRLTGGSGESSYVYLVQSTYPASSASISGVDASQSIRAADLILQGSPSASGLDSDVSIGADGWNGADYASQSLDIANSVQLIGGAAEGADVSIGASGMASWSATSVSLQAGSANDTAASVNGTQGFALTTSGSLSVGGGSLAGASLNYAALGSSSGASTLSIAGDVSVVDGLGDFDEANLGAATTLTLGSGGTVTLQASPASEAPELYGTDIQLNSGTVAGNATLFGQVSNAAASLAPGASAGTLQVQGTLAQGAEASLDIELAGTGPAGSDYDSLTVGGPATLGGTLNVSLINEYVPALGDGFTLVSATSLSGSFSVEDLPDLSAQGLAWEVSYGSSDSVVLSVVANSPPVADYPQIPNLLVNPSFESPETVTGGPPNSRGDWQGDISAIVEAENGITPTDGSHMLRFYTTQPLGGGDASSGQMYQLIDLAPYSTAIDTGEASLSASALFNRVAGDASTDTEFTVTVSAYTGDPADFPSQWETGEPSQLTSIITDGDPGTWEALNNDFAIPAGTDYVAVTVAAVENISNDETAELDGHYVDQVSAQLNLPSPYPVVENGQATLTLHSHDPEADPITTRITALSTHGSLYQTSDGVTPGVQITEIGTVVTDAEARVIYVPDPDYDGPDKIAYGVDDGNHSTFVKVDPSAAYLHTSGDDAANATPIALADLGIAPGDFIRLESVGDFSPSSANPESDSLSAVFSASDTLLPDTELNRVQDALDAGADFTSPVTFYGSETTDIPEDFRISNHATFNSVVVQVPDGASYLFLNTPDGFYSDNTDTDNGGAGDFGVQITRLSSAPVDLDVLSVNQPPTTGGFSDVSGGGSSAPSVTAPPSELIASPSPLAGGGTGAGESTDPVAEAASFEPEPEDVEYISAAIKDQSLDRIYDTESSLADLGSQLPGTSHLADELGFGESLLKRPGEQARPAEKGLPGGAGTGGLTNALAGEATRFSAEAAEIIQTLRQAAEYLQCGR